MQKMGEVEAKQAQFLLNEINDKVSKVKTKPIKIVKI
jgi:hypothetical protein